MARKGYCIGCGKMKELYDGVCLKCMGEGVRPVAHADCAADYAPSPIHGHSRHHHFPEHPGHITTEERAHLPNRLYALPHRRELPIHGPAHIRDSVSRLEQMLHRWHSVTPAEYEEAKHNIVREARHWGIHVKYMDRGGHRHADTSPLVKEFRKAMRKTKREMERLREPGPPEDEAEVRRRVERREQDIRRRLGLDRDD